MIEDMTIKELTKLLSAVGGSATKADDSHWKVGENYFIRTVTYHFTGRLIRVTPSELVLVDAAWIADAGRFSECMAKGSVNEVEPFPDGLEVIVGRGSLIDAARWTHPLPRDVK